MRIALVAGEPSGDLLGANLLTALKTRWPQLQAYGVGGPQMQAQGFDVQWPYDPLSVHGYADAIKNLPQIWSLRQALYRKLSAQPPDAFIGIDAPDFNLGLERKLKAQGIPSLHFISPSIWAWRAGRLRKIGQSVDHMLCVFPFEPALYEQANISASFVGHPLAASIPLQTDTNAAKRALGLDCTRPVLALLPGSRLGEIERIAPPFMTATQALLKQKPDLQVVLPAIPKFYDILAQMLREHGLTQQVLLLQGQSHPALAACDVTLIASGTATLEAMLFKKPMVISYITSPISASIMRRMGYLPWVGLPNILAKRSLVPELLQERATPAALTQVLLHWLENPQAVQALQADFQQIHLSLLANTSELVCDAVQHTIEKRTPMGKGH